MWLRLVNYSDLPPNLDLKDDNPTTFPSSGGIGELILLILIFVLIIAACYFVTKFIGGKQLNQMKNSNFTVLDTYRITQNKFLQLVRMGNQYVVIAVTKDKVSVIAHLTEEEVIKPEHKPNEMTSFSHVFSNIVNKKKSEEKVDMK
jgi:flagellar protein FliO/FliZ